MASFLKFHSLHGQKSYFPNNKAIIVALISHYGGYSDYGDHYGRLWP